MKHKGITAIFLFFIQLKAMQSRELLTSFRQPFFERRARDFIQQHEMAVDDLSAFVEMLDTLIRTCGELLLPRIVLLVEQARGSIGGFRASDIVIGLDPRFLDQKSDQLLWEFAQWNEKNHEYILRDLLGCCVSAPDEYERSTLKLVTHGEIEHLVEKVSDDLVYLKEANTFEFALAISRQLPSRQLCMYSDAK